MVIHVFFMIFAWLFCAPLAVTVARLRHFERFKPFLTRTRFKGGRQYWYLIHRNCLASAVILTLIGGILIISGTTYHFYYLHSNFGLVVMALAAFQVQPRIDLLERSSERSLARQSLHRRSMGCTASSPASASVQAGSDFIADSV